MFKRFQKRPDNGLQKKVRFSAGALYLRLALERSKYDRESIDLDAYYKAAQDLIQERNKCYQWYGIVLGALYFSHLGVLRSFDVLGLGLSPLVVKHFLLILVAIMSIICTMTMTKLERYNQLFTKLFKVSDGAKKQDLILRYPRMYSPMHFGSWMTGSPKFMYPDKDYPIRTIILIIALVPATILMMAFCLWLIGVVPYDLWFDRTSGVAGWSRWIVLATWGVFLSGMLLPTITLRKITFWHTGLLNTLEGFSIRSPQRYSHYISKVADADERRGGTALSKK